MLSHLDPLTLLFASALMTLVISLVLWVSRISLDEAGPGVAFWIAGDIAMSLARWQFLAEVPEGSAPPSAHAVVLPGGLWMLGAAAHLEALRRVAGQVGSPARPWAQGLGAAALFSLPALLLPTANHRAIWLHGLMLAAIAVTLHALWPARRLRGARVIGCMLLLGFIALPVRIWELLAALHTETSPGSVFAKNAGVLAMVADLVIGLSLSTGFLLLLQERVRARIERLVITDALTGAVNRHGLMPMLRREMFRARRHGRPLSVVLFDLDHFKRVNDQLGHGVGDRVLVGFTQRAQSLMRGGDIFGRWGGEEFLLVLPDTPLPAALAVAERIRAEVADRPLTEGAPVITVSAGVACSDEPGAFTNGPPDLAALLESADQRMYRAKARRNMVVAAH